MAKPAPPAPTSLSLESLGVIGYLDEIGSVSTTALESLATLEKSASGGVVVSVPEGSPETTVIYKKDGAYHVFIHTNELSSTWWSTNLNAFTEFTMSLTADDTIYLYQTGSVYCMPDIVQALIVLDSLCFAKKIFVVDHIIETPLFLLVCQSLVIEDTGAVTFSNCIAEDVKQAEQIFRPYLARLYARAVSSGLLTKDEVKSILEDNRIVFKLARELRTNLKLVA